MYPIFEIPLQFIDQYLNRRWIIIVIILLIIYFYYLRQWYFKRDSFITGKKITKSSKNNKKKNKDTKTKTNKNEHIENFINNTSKQSVQLEIEVSKNLFINLQLTDSQMKSVLDNYKNVINNAILNLIKLSEQQRKNQYLRVDKSFGKIIADCVDNIINFITLTIKSQYSLTRTDVKTDILQTLKLNIITQTDKINNQLTKEMNLLATMNSTTLDYNQQLSTVNNLRTNLDNLMNIDQLITNNGNNDSKSTLQINKALNKSNVLPIYEKNIDRINQVLNSDFNGNEEKLTDKYGKMYTQFLEEEKTRELDINPLQLGSKVESGIVDLLSGLFSKQSTNIPKNDDKVTSTNLVEQYGFTDNTISRPVKNIIPQQEPLQIKSSVLNENNIFIDPGTRGSYLIDNKTRKTITEGFKTSTDNTNNNEYDNKIYGFTTYMLDTIKNTLGPSYNSITSKFTSYNFNDVSNNVKLEDNMIPAGFLLFLLSMFLYFIDITS
jgi:hypothetical protein